MYKFLFFCVFVTSSIYGQDCKGIQKKINKNVGTTAYIATAKARLLKSSDPNELDLLISRKFISSTDTVYDIIIYKAVSQKPDKESLKGVSLIFEDGSQIERPEQSIEIGKLAGNLVLLTQCQLKPEEVIQLSQKTLVKVKLMTNEHNLYSKMAQSFQQNTGCLLQSF
jgi:hypothetical protein